MEDLDPLEDFALAVLMAWKPLAPIHQRRFSFTGLLERHYGRSWKIPLFPRLPPQ